ncbi:CocE/NonD family hydrolase [Ottowia testudinis]|uniref:Hydrolase n=1 Tax=Ottowia testudinis TaxID=2816950 RepID=A0A975H394_9BURK|nr:CocE/NonD family hydrolase [Ottowia testudinis]QTD45678.1 hydrolase [Ottowia testudinis]
MAFSLPRSHRWLPGACAVLGALACAAPVQAQQLIGCRDATPAEAAFYSTPVIMPGVISPRDGTCYVKDLRITTHDGLKLTANVFLPAGATSGVAGGQKFPGVVYISSWALTDSFEYLGQQARMARDGYISVAYTTRGFWGSEGVISVASEGDIRDVSTAIDFMQAFTPVDAARIGTAGISYGAGMSLLASARDKRIRALAALSGWGNLSDQLFGNQVPNPTWTAVLLGSGQLLGRMDPAVVSMSRETLNPDATPEQAAAAMAWAVPRSPSAVVNQINANQPAVFIGKNWQDDMFSPNSTLALFEKLTTPKRISLQPGIHGSIELGAAMFDKPNLVWDQAHRWFDRYLKGVPNGIDAEPKVRLTTKFGNVNETLSTWPAPELKRNVLWVNPRGPVRYDWSCWCMKGLVGSMNPARGPFGLDTINNALDTTATTGPLPVLSVTAETIGLPVINHQDSILRDQGVRYEGPVLSQGMKIRGAPQVQLRVRPSQKRGMLVAYLYDVDALGWGTLITHGARAVHWATPGQSIDFSFDLNAIAYDVAPGRKLALVFDTADHLYGAPVRWGEAFSMTIEAGDGVSALTIPSR